MYELLVLPSILIVLAFLMIKYLAPLIAKVIKYFILKRKINVLNKNLKGLKGMELYKAKQLLLFDVKDFDDKPYSFTNMMNRDRH